MSIFTSIFAFIAKLFGGIKREYLNLEPSIKSIIDGIIQAGNVIKNYIANPGAAGPVSGELIILLENTIGTSMVSLILSVINEVIVDLGIAETALTDPSASLQALLDHLKTLKGKPFADFLFNMVTTIVERVTTVFAGNQAKAIVAFVYDTFFKTTPIVLPTKAA